MAADEEVRGKLDPELHRKLSAIAYAYKRTMGDCLREAIEQFVEREITKAHEAKVLLRILNDHGTEADSARKAIP